MSQNAYSVGDLVYLAESAKVGSLESYQISGVRQDASGEWLYRISIPQRSPNALPTYGDRITLTNSLEFELHEYELTDFCDAIDLAIAHVSANLAALQALKANRCPDSSGSGSGSGVGVGVFDGIRKARCTVWRARRRSDRLADDRQSGVLRINV